MRKSFVFYNEFQLNLNVKSMYEKGLNKKKFHSFISCLEIYDKIKFDLPSNPAKASLST